MENTSNENIAEALQLLEKAAGQKKDELMTLMSDKYTNLRSLIMAKENSLMKSLTTAKDNAVEAATHAKDASVEKVREVVGDVDKSVRQNPWPYIGGTAVIGVLTGYILGRSRK
jgi:ElaB/YqjD/DUF883 family membrane-anchored ribosome-binding protein